jgi:hypothetical protein
MLTRMLHDEGRLVAQRLNQAPFGDKMLSKRRKRGQTPEDRAESADPGSTTGTP